MFILDLKNNTHTAFRPPVQNGLQKSLYFAWGNDPSLAFYAPTENVQIWLRHHSNFCVWKKSAITFDEGCKCGVIISGREFQTGQYIVFFASLKVPHEHWLQTGYDSKSWATGNFRYLANSRQWVTFGNWFPELLYKQFYITSWLDLCLDL